MTREMEEQDVAGASVFRKPVKATHDVAPRRFAVDQRAYLRPLPAEAAEKPLDSAHVVDATPELRPGANVVDPDEERALPARGRRRRPRRRRPGRPGRRALLRAAFPFPFPARSDGLPAFRAEFRARL